MFLSAQKKPKLTELCAAELGLLLAGSSTQLASGHSVLLTCLPVILNRGYMGKQDTLEIRDHGAGHRQNSDICMCLYVITHHRASEIFVAVGGIALNVLAIMK